MARQTLVDDMVAEVAALDHDAGGAAGLAAVQAPRDAADRLRRHRPRAEPATRSPRQISYLADAIVEAAVRPRWRQAAPAAGQALRPDGQPARFVVLGMGKLGGIELNYSSDIDLIFIYEADGKTDGRRSISNAEFFDRLAREVLRLLTEPTEMGAAYRVDMRLRPDGQRGPIVVSLDSALHYYDVRGRTWERQAYVKARPVAGDLDLGQEFLGQLEPWIYRRYLSRADITGIKALKRRIEQRTHARGRRQPQRQDRPRRHPRHRVRHSVPAASQRRRSGGRCAPAIRWRPLPSSKTSAA